MTNSNFRVYDGNDENGAILSGHDDASDGMRSWTIQKNCLS
jgi:hypothetical protein